MGFLEWGWFNGFVAHGGVHLAYRFYWYDSLIEFSATFFFSFKIVPYLKEEDKNIFGKNTH